MKASPNREQQIFLIAGAVIFGLILVVVVYNMIQDPMRVVEEPISAPPVVAEPNRPGADEQAANWIETMRAAPGANSGAAPIFQAESASARPVIPPSDAEPAPAPANDGPLEDAGPAPADQDDIIQAWATQDQQAATPPARPAAQTAPARSPSAFSQAAQTPPPPPRQTPSAPSAPVVAAAPAPSAPPAPSPAPAVSGDGYSVQLGAFSTRQSAAALQSRVGALTFRGRPLPTFQKEAVVNGRTFYRVRVGPFVDRATAGQAADMVRGQPGLGLNPQVLAPGR